MNVRDASAAQISGNAEIQNIKQILGLQHGKVRWLLTPASMCLQPAARPTMGCMHRCMRTCGHCATAT